MQTIANKKPTKPIYNIAKSVYLIVYALVTTMIISNISHAKPNLKTPVDLSILHRADTGYHFVSQTFKVAKPNITHNPALQKLAMPRKYRVWLGIPNHSTDSVNASKPVMYFLDGNAALANTTAKTLQYLAKAQAPVLVFIGYDVPWRFDTQARAFDYTPPIQKQMVQDEYAQRLNGGAPLFGNFLQERLKPWVVAELSKKNIQMDINNQILWGHSYGGLFALYSLLYQPNMFSQYEISDPSLWWQNQHFVKIMQENLPIHEYVLKHTSEFKQSRQSKQSSKFGQQIIVNLSFSGSSKHYPSRMDANKTRQHFINQLCVLKQIRCEYKFYENQTHGQLFKTSLLNSYKPFQIHQ